MSGSSPCTLSTLTSSPDITVRRLSVRAGGDDTPVSAVAILAGPSDLGDLRVNDFVVVRSEANLRLDASSIARKCAEVGVAGVGWPEGESFELLATALSEQGVPTFEIGRTTRASDLANVVARANAAPESTRFQRVLHMQQQLVDALLAEPPVESLIATLARVTGGIAGVTRDDGSVETASGVLPFALFRQEAAIARGEDIEFQVAGWSAVAKRLRILPGESTRWLFVARRQHDFLSVHVRAAVNVASSLLDATRRINEIASHQDLVTRAFVLEQALETEPYENSDLLATRVGALGIDFTADVRVLEIHRAHSAHQAGNKERGLRDHVLSSFDSASLLVLERAGGATVLAQCTADTLESALTRILRLETGLLIGVGRPLRRIGEARVSWHDATLAAEAARRSQSRRIMRYDDFDLSTRLLADVDRTEMAYWVQEILAPVRAKPNLLEALIVYFEQDLDIMRSAKVLKIHHNTMRYRLAKVEEALGGSLQSPAQISSLHLALSAERSPGETSRPLRPSDSQGRRGANNGDTDVLLGGAVAPLQLGPGDEPLVG